MSGGRLDYFFTSLQDHEEDFDDIELNDLMKDLSQLYHDREWYLSGDTCKGEWIEQRDAFKKKWFGRGARIKRIDNYLEQTRNELIESLGLSDKKCTHCVHYGKMVYEKYGECDVTQGCLKHRSDSCSKYIKREEKNGDTKSNRTAEDRAGVPEKK